jgi:RHS repeat-associated protein
VQASYRYDPLGRRIAKSVTQGGVTTTTYFIYSDAGLLAEANDQGQLTKAYGFNPMASGLWSTDPVWQANVANGSLTDAGTSYNYLHTDQLSTPILATDKQGNISWKAVAESFGSTGVLPGNTITMNLRFPGQYFDQESGTHDNFMRSYDPRIGRYSQVDPIGLQGGWNLYEYVDEDPIDKMDPEGLAPKTECELFIEDFRRVLHDIGDKIDDINHALRDPNYRIDFSSKYRVDAQTNGYRNPNDPGKSKGYKQAIDKLENDWHMTFRSIKARTSIGSSIIFNHRQVQVIFLTNELERDIYVQHEMRKYLDANCSK